MPSWRDSASQQSQGDLDALLNASLPFAQQMLEKRGEFFPYGSVISLDGEMRMVAGEPGQGDRPLSNDVIATMLAAIETADPSPALLDHHVSRSMPSRSETGGSHPSLSAVDSCARIH